MLRRKSLGKKRQEARSRQQRPLSLESLEDRNLLAFDAFSQLSLELINQARDNSGAQPLAPNTQLFNAAQTHNTYMHANQVIRHCGPGNNHPTDRIAQAGYDLSDDVPDFVENLGFGFNTSQTREGVVEIVHDGLFASAEHRRTMLEPSYSEAGIASDQFTGLWNGRIELGTPPTCTFAGNQNVPSGVPFVLETQIYGAPASGESFLTGVVINDADSDNFYDVGEGVSGAVVIASQNGAEVSRTTSLSTGGYSLGLAEGTYQIEVRQGGLSTSTTVSISDENVKRDFDTRDFVEVNPDITTVGDRSTVVGANASITFSFIDPNVGDQHTAAINWGDGSGVVQLGPVTSPFTASHTYETAGNFTPRVWVTDMAGNTAIEDFQMTVFPSAVPPTTPAPTPVPTPTPNPTRPPAPPSDQANPAPIQPSILTAPDIATVGDRSALAQADAVITFSFIDSTINDRHTAAIDWGDGTPVTQLGSVTSPFVGRHTYATTGTFMPRVWVTDALGQTAIEDFQMTVYPSNLPPAPVVPPTPATGSPDITTVGDRSSIVGANGRITFSFIDPTAHDTHTAAIDWGDGSPIAQLGSVTSPFVAAHEYETAGSYVPKLWVTDASNLTAIEEFNMTVYPGQPASPPAINIDPAAPVIGVISDRTAVVGAMKSVTFDFTDANPGQTHSASIDWGDGTAFTHLNSVSGTFTASHVYESAGNFTPRVWVTDQTLRTDRESFSMTIFPAPVVNTPPPTDANEDPIPRAPVVIPPGNRTAALGQDAVVTIGFTDPNDPTLRNDSYSAAIDWGDGTALTQLESINSPFTVTHRYRTAGIFEPIVWVTDSRGLSHAQTFTMNVAYLELAPDVELVLQDFAVGLCGPIGGSFSCGSNFEFTALVDDLNNDTGITAAVDWGDGSGIEDLGSVYRVLSARHTYVFAESTQVPTYDVTLWVTDSTARSTRLDFSTGDTGSMFARTIASAFEDADEWWDTDR